MSQETYAQRRTKQHEIAQKCTNRCEFVRHVIPQSEVLAKFSQETGEKRGEHFTKYFTDIRPSISRENGRKKVHENSSTFSTVHQIKFLDCCNSGRCRAQEFAQRDARSTPLYLTRLWSSLPVQELFQHLLQRSTFVHRRGPKIWEAKFTPQIWGVNLQKSLVLQCYQACKILESLNGGLSKWGLKATLCNLRTIVYNCALSWPFCAPF